MDNYGPKVMTWYVPGEEKPWRMASSLVPAEWLGEKRCETYHELMMEVADAWTRLQPEPVEPRPGVPLAAARPAGGERA
jgi:hypothetical protein